MYRILIIDNDRNRAADIWEALRLHFAMSNAYIYAYAGAATFYEMLDMSAISYTHVLLNLSFEKEMRQVERNYEGEMHQCQGLFGHMMKGDFLTSPSTHLIAYDSRTAGNSFVLACLSRFKRAYRRIKKEDTVPYVRFSESEFTTFIEQVIATIKKPPG